MTYKIFIDGQEGTTGLKIHKRLQSRKDLEIITIADEDRKDKEARLEMISQSDVTFLCLPDAASREIVERADKSWRILDTSTAHRTNENWVYGFPELDRLQRNKIKGSNRVAVPGCHATGFISLIKPLIFNEIIKRDYPLVCHSITGYSGGGKNMISQYEAENREVSFESPRQYCLDQNHKHLPEMMAMTGIECSPIFHPIVADYFSGMLVTISLHSRLLEKKLTQGELRQILSDYYKGQSMIQVKAMEQRPSDGFMTANILADNDGLQIFICGNEEQLVLISRYDNLGKGASGAAIQCMNIMLDIPEETGLTI